ncbi:MAG: ferrous iron transport protein B [Planctomycetes bacterium]|nr:ferrous iron transport protein B [Planctomycetota bacterium]
MSAEAPAGPARTRLPLVALAGNPNTGKTTLFNRLTRSDRKVANYPGITVERHEGELRLPGGRTVRVLDVPGTYSLSARSREEEIAIDSVAGLRGEPEPDLVVLVADATQLSRNLYMALQVLELEVPLVVALNMSDALAARGASIDVDALSNALGVAVVAIAAQKGQGLAALESAIERALAAPDGARPGARWQPGSVELAADLERVGAVLPPEWSRGNPARVRALAAWALLSLDEHDELRDVPEALRRAVIERRAQAQQTSRQIETEIIRGRYDWIDALTASVVREGPQARTATERADAVLLNPWIGFPLFLLAMSVVFLALFSWSEPAIGAIEAGFGVLTGLVRDALGPGILRDFVTDGLIAGVGSVVVFLPQILLLFLFIGILEDTGYMARVACIMDRLMRAMGLSGRAFVPMLSGYACAVPAILATRTMERQRDRTLTMMVVPLMTCSARLPVYTLVIGALFPPTLLLGFAPVQSLMLVAMYLFSALMALVVAAVLSRTMLKGPRVPLILEMPPYRTPHWPSVLRQMFQKARTFLTEAGSVILVCTIALWGLLAFPKDAQREERRETLAAAIAAAETETEGRESQERVEALTAEDAALAGEALRESYGGRLGRAIEPAIEPLGFDWKIGVGLIGAFAAREVFVATLGVVYGMGGVDEDSTTLRERIRAETRANGEHVYTPLTGLSLMIFFALACQCMSTLAAVRRETRSWGWVLFLFAYMTALAWIASFAVYQGGRALGFS